MADPVAEHLAPASCNRTTVKRLRDDRAKCGRCGRSAGGCLCGRRSTCRSWLDRSAMY